MVRALLIAVCTGIVLQFSNGCLNYDLSRFARNDRQLQRFVRKNHQEVVVKYYHVGNYHLRMAVFGDTTKPKLLMVHGSPGSLSEYDSYFTHPELMKKYCMVAIDRPGYGFSKFGKVDTSILRQSKAVYAAFQFRFPQDSFSIIGNSFGGPVAATVAALGKGKVKHLFLVASAIAPGRERIYSISKYIDQPQLKPFFPQIIQMPNDEKLSHERSLMTIAPLLAQVTAPITMLHGTSDDLIYFSNTQYAKEVFKKADTLVIIPVPNKKHPILWSDQPLVLQELLK